MGDFIIKTADLATWIPAFGKATILAPIPFPMIGTAKHNVNVVPACVEGDEKTVIVPSPYISPPYTVPGAGVITIKKLASDQLTTTTKSGGKKIILKGSQYDAKFQVAAPAIYVNEATGVPTPDPTPIYDGKGSFITTNFLVKAT